MGCTLSGCREDVPHLRPENHGPTVAPSVAGTVALDGALKPRGVFDRGDTETAIRPSSSSRAASVTGRVEAVLNES
jgi:hypothetical protein